MNTLAFYQRLSLGLLLLSTGLSAQAQVTRTPDRSAADTVAAPTKPVASRFQAATFTFITGKKVVGYLENYSYTMADQVLCYETLPEGKKWPRIKSIDIGRLKSMEVDGRTLEPLYFKGSPMRIIAQPVTSGGKLELFDIIINQQAMTPVGTRYGSYSGPVYNPSNYQPTSGYGREKWYVRLKGGELQKVPKGAKAFAELMSVMFADCPELAEKIRLRAPDANFEYLPRLAREYNAYFESKK